MQARDPFLNGPAPKVTASTTSPHVVDTATPSDPAPATAASSTVTVTVTAPAGATTSPGTATYVGLYAWNGGRASFRVNARTYSVTVGTRFGPGLTFASVVGTNPRCARVTYASGDVTLCPGQVVPLS